MITEILEKRIKIVTLADLRESFDLTLEDYLSVFILYITFLWANCVYRRKPSLLTQTKQN